MGRILGIREIFEDNPLNVTILYSCKYLCHYHKITRTTAKNSYFLWRTNMRCVHPYLALLTLQ